jgi:hypothetical protein
MPHPRPGAALLPALLLLLTACAAAPGPSAERPLEAQAWAQAYLAEAGQTFVPGSGGLVWLGVISQELRYDEAVYYCRSLPDHGPEPWRVPTVDELRGAPFARYTLPEEAVRLWSSTLGTGELYRRWVVDPRTGARELKDVRQDVRLRVLCVTAAAR